MPITLHRHQYQDYGRRWHPALGGVWLKLEQCTVCRAHRTTPMWTFTQLYRRRVPMLNRLMRRMFE